MIYAFGTILFCALGLLATWLVLRSGHVSAAVGLAAVLIAADLLLGGVLLHRLGDLRTNPYTGPCLAELEREHPAGVRGVDSSPLHQMCDVVVKGWKSLGAR